MAVSPDDNVLAVGSTDKSVSLYDLNTYEMVHRFEGLHTGHYLKFLTKLIRKYRCCDSISILY